MNKNLLTLLRCLGAGDKTILQAPNGDYVGIQCKSMPSLVPQGSEERSVEGRLMYELFGEYPLSPSQKPDWDLVRKAFVFNEETRTFFPYDNHLMNFKIECKADVEKAVNEIDGLCVKGWNDKLVGVYAKAGYDNHELRIEFAKKYNSSFL